MSKIIMRRDFSDEAVIQQFADLVGNLENLRMLCLLTYADVKAVNNEVLTPWKEDLMWQLYIDTYNLLTLGLADDQYSQQPSLETDIDEVLRHLPRGTLRAGHSRLSSMAFRDGTRRTRRKNRSPNISCCRGSFAKAAHDHALFTEGDRSTSFL